MLLFFYVASFFLFSFFYVSSACRVYFQYHSDVRKLSAVVDFVFKCSSISFLRVFRPLQRPRCGVRRSRPDREHRCATLCNRTGVKHERLTLPACSGHQPLASCIIYRHRLAADVTLTFPSATAMTWDWGHALPTASCVTRHSRHTIDVAGTPAVTSQTA